MKSLSVHYPGFRRSLLALLFLLSVAAVAAAQSAPAVTKVEPPNWWAGHSLNPVRLLIRGRNLSGARVQAAGAGLSVGATQANAAGTYLFVDVSIEAGAPPGTQTLRITTTAGSDGAQF